MLKFNIDSINTMKFLSMDMINKANSGHPGICLGAAPMLYTLYNNHLVSNPQKPNWINRDRFVMAAGHGSALLYTTLHLSGFDLSIDDLKQFRQLDSKTPGHPEYGHTAGVDATSGPLGQGIPMAVGMSIAERFLANKFNREGKEIIDHYTYALCGDGDLMEGVTLEAISLAGHLKLGKLVVLYDSNDITLDGELNDSFSEDTKDKFEALGWQYIKVLDGNDCSAIDKAITKAKKTTTKPTIIEVKTKIGDGTSKEGTSKAHGSPIGVNETDNLRKKLNYNLDLFEVDEKVYEDFEKKFIKRGQKEYLKHEKELDGYLKNFKKDYDLFLKAINGELEINISDYLKELGLGEKISTREASEIAINTIADAIPTFIGGSADLASSNKTNIKNDSKFTPDNLTGRNICFGIREHAMAAVANGMALHGGLKVFVATFFVFSDYLKPAVRMAALMNLPITYVFTHDSIAVGEDGPTHQPIEQLAMFRAMPNVNVIRPSDANETFLAWEIAYNATSTPTVLALTRQAVPVITNSKNLDTKRGAYIVKDADNFEGVLIATGSEVSLALEVAQELEKKNISVRVVNIASWELFDKQELAYKNEILPPNVSKRLVIEMASGFGWERYSLSSDAIYCINTFGASGNANDVIKSFKFTAVDIANKYLNLK